MKQFFSFTKKEFIHIFRDPRTMLILLAMPIVLILLFGFAISTEVKNVRVAIYDHSKTIETQQIIDNIEASEYFIVIRELKSPNEADQLFRRSVIDMAIIFAPDYGNHPAVQLITDASDPNTATIGQAYASAIIGSSDRNIQPLIRNSTFLYNPSQLSSFNFVPGVMGMILMLICAMMTSISIVREKELGTMEVLLVSPVHPVRLLMAKLVPYLTLSIINLITILLVSVFILGVPIAGSLMWLFLFSILFIFVTLALGLLISTIARTQVIAMLISGMVLMMPTVLLSGMMFPVDNMPIVLQWISAGVPARWYIDGVRKLMIQGVEVQFVTKEFVILASMAIVLITVSLKKFKVRL
ncbi:MAG: ABC transporter permease [Mucinivorans sp.]